MTAEQLTTVLTGAPLLVAVIGGAWSLSARLTTLGAKVDVLGARLDRLEMDTGHDLAGMKGTLSTLMMALVSSKAVAEGSVLEAALGPWHQQIERERHHRNPLTTDELARFERYYEKVSRKEPLEQGEFQDYRALTAKLYRDRPNDPAIWALLGLGALLLAFGLVKSAD